MWTDVAALHALAGAVAGARDPTPAQAAAWAQDLLVLARGPLLPESAAPWVVTARERLRRVLAGAAEPLAGWLQAGQPALARAVLRRAFDHDPSSEPLARALALHLLGRGEPREAERVLQLCLHSRDLHDEPPASPELRALRLRIDG